jgi:uncharacterized protein YdeI (YjbR/CyaY-like superfamily)
MTGLFCAGEIGPSVAAPSSTASPPASASSSPANDHPRPPHRRLPGPRRPPHLARGARRLVDGIRIKVRQEAHRHRHVSKAEAVDAALCHGWIDGQLQPFDADFWLTALHPRAPRSVWSEKNRERALELIAEGRMTPAGLAQIEAAQADGRWDRRYARQSSATVPADLQAALDADPPPPPTSRPVSAANRFAVIYRVNDAKRPETRARRIAQLVAMLARGETPH